MGANGTRTLRIKLADCTGCRSCTIACAIQHGQRLSFQAARIRVDKEFPEIKVPVFKPVFCRMCRNAKCIPVCAPGALSENKETGNVDLDETLCNGCGECVQACPFHAIWLNEQSGLAVKCDLCGGDPVCVQNCPPNALVYE